MEGGKHQDRYGALLRRFCAGAGQNVMELAKRQRLSELDAIHWKDRTALKVHMRVILADIFTRFFKNHCENETGSFPEWFCSFLVRMERPENFTADMKEIVEASGRSREHLSRSIKKYLGVSFSEYINDLRINYAANLLLNSNRNIVDIGYLCGFQNASYFYRVFSKKYGIAPPRLPKPKQSPARQRLGFLRSCIYPHFLL